MNKKLKRILIGVGIGLGVLVIGAGIAYAVMTDTPGLEREVGVLEELLPKGAESYMTADLTAAGKLYKSSKIGHLARKHDIEEDFSNLSRVAKIQEQTKGRFWDVLGSRFIYASYGEKRFLLITQPSWKVKAMWRSIIAKGDEKSSQGIPYTVFTGGTAAFFAGDYFWYASSEKLLLKGLAIASSEDLKEEKAFPIGRGIEPLAYGLLRKPGKYLVFDEARWVIEEGGKGLRAKVQIDNPSGVLGGLIANAKPPEDYSKIPADAALFISLAGVNPYRAWKEAGKLSSEEGITEVLGDLEIEKEFAKIAVDLEDHVLFIMQGWDVDKWYAPARWLLSLKAGSERSFESWTALTPWFFPNAWDTTLTHGEVAYTMLDLGEDLPPITYLFNNSYLTVANDSALVPWMLDAYSAGLTLDGSEEFAAYREAAGISEPVACVNWPMFKEELKEYLIYAADRTSGFTPADVEGKLFPLLDALEMKALLVEMEHKGKTLAFTIRSAN